MLMDNTFSTKPICRLCNTYVTAAERLFEHCVSFMDVTGE